MTPLSLYTVMLLLFVPSRQAAGDEACMMTDAEGNLHLNPAPQARVLVNGADILQEMLAQRAEIAALKAALSSYNGSHAVLELLVQQMQQQQQMQLHLPGKAVLLVIGAGTDDANGYYKANGDFNSKPQYLKVRTLSYR